MEEKRTAEKEAWGRDYFFIEEGLEAAIPEGVGILTGEKRDPSASLGQGEREELRAAFRGAYGEAMLRGSTLMGVLGADRVHGWPEGDSLSWAQNWRSSQSRPNSWGLGDLVLALRSLDSPDGQVFLVEGPILDLYGISGGWDRANGSLGYGNPRENAQYRGNRLTQVFEFGYFYYAGEDDKGFITWNSVRDKAPRASTAGGMPERNATEEKFLEFWRQEGIINATGSPRSIAMNRELLIPDGSVETVDLGEDAWKLTLGDREIGVTRLEIQWFNNQGSCIIDMGVPLGGSAMRLLRGEFLRVLCAEQGIQGAEALERGKIGEKKGKTGELIAGLSRYGLPLSGELRREERGRLRRACRFSKGWIYVPD